MPGISYFIIKSTVYFRQTSDEQLIIRRQAKAYTLGVVFTFVVIASLLIVLKSLGHQLGWGFTTEPCFCDAISYCNACWMHFNNLLQLPSWVSMLPSYLSKTHYKLTAERDLKTSLLGC